MSVILGIDPGGTTGAVKYQSNRKEFSIVKQFGAEQHHSDLARWIDANLPDLIVYERFDYRRNMKNVDLSAVEYIGVIKLTCQEAGYNYVEQQQLKGHRGLWTDSKLKTLGLYEPGKVHAMDAIRQVLYYVTIELGDEHWVRLYKELTT